MAEMSEMDSQTAAANRDGSPAAPTAHTETVPGGSNGDSQIPGDELEALRNQLKQANDESAARRHKIKELEEKITAAERKDMAEVDRLKAELADLQGADKAREELTSRVERYEAVIQIQVDQLLKELKVPEYITTLLEEKSPADKLDYLLANRDKLQPEAKRKPEFDADKKGGSKTPLNDKEKEARENSLRQRMRLRRR